VKPWQNATNLQILDDAQWGTRKMCCNERPNAFAIVVVSCYDDTNESNFLHEIIYLQHYACQIFVSCTYPTSVICPWQQSLSVGPSFNIFEDDGGLVIYYKRFGTDPCSIQQMCNLAVSPHAFFLLCCCIFSLNSQYCTCQQWHRFLQQIYNQLNF
jgi:hypothetical protein